ncbi:MAG TPA: 50S ribosomal protein L4 [Dehalococcoidia bacterium]|nr:50S ribosomal protein L4 [Dehalococcoidia bacterium]
MQLAVKNLDGQTVGQVDLRDEVFAVPFNQAVVHQALVRQLANARQGTSDTKTRGEVSGGGRKPWKQKGTGRARQGSIRSPHWKGGGVVFGPHPRDFSQDMPKKMRRLALLSAISSKVSENLLVLVEDLRVDEARTKEMAELLKRLDIEASALLVLAEIDPKVIRAARNIPRVSTQLARSLSVGDVLSHQYIIMPVSAARQVEETFAAAREE